MDKESNGQGKRWDRMMTRRAFLAGALGTGTLLGMGGLLAACSTPAAAPTSAPAAAPTAGAGAAASKKLSIAYVCPGLDAPFWKYLSDGIKQEASKAGATVTDFDSRNDAATQLKNAQDVITRKMDAIILSPTDSSTAPAVLKVAADAKVPVIIADIGTDSGEYVSWVISTNAQGGKDACELLAKQLKAKGWAQGPIGMIQISQARINGKNRTKGAMEALDAAGVKVVQYLEAQKYVRDEAKQFAQDMLTAHPDIHGIFAQYDEGALGAMAAIQAAGRQNDVLLASFDGGPETMEAIKTGKQIGVAVQQPVEMGRQSFKAVYAFLNGQQVQKQIDVPTFLVTPDNIASLQSKIEDSVFPKQ